MSNGPEIWRTQGRDDVENHGVREPRSEPAPTPDGGERGLKTPTWPPEGHAVNIRTVMPGVGEGSLEADIKQAAGLVERGHTDLAIHVLREAIPALREPRVPEGWKLVPVEPRGAMGGAGWAVLDGDDLPLQGLKLPPNLPHRVYEAMLTAAPQPQEGESDE